MPIVPIESIIEKKVRVWDIGVRAFHWSLVAMFASAYLFAEQRALHRYLGYAVAGLIAFRLIWGLAGTKHARFADFVPGPMRLLRYLRDMASGREARSLGHNPAGAAMIVALLTTISGIAATGYMIGMDAYFGVEWVETLHKSLVNLALGLIVFHLCGVIFSSFRHRENLVKAMITGEKRLED
jgi:cytochrome b